MQGSCLYVGTVVHKRLRPRTHALSYRVYSLFIDLDRVDEFARRLRLFSSNRFNAVSLFDRDHGSNGRAPTTANGPAPPVRLADHARATFAAAGIPEAGATVMLSCYPRVMGYGFNPIAVYYGYDTAQRLAGVIYEVNNTFGERHSYVVSVDGAAVRVHAHGCEKRLYVSPFTEMAGRYSFRLTEPGDEMLLAVMLRDADGPVLKTHVRATARPLDDAGLARLLVGMPLLTLKIIGGIHYEALRLWLKGVPLTSKPAGPRYAASTVPSTASAVDVIPLPPTALPSQLAAIRG